MGCGTSSARDVDEPQASTATSTSKTESAPVQTRDRADSVASNDSDLERELGLTYERKTHPQAADGGEEEEEFAMETEDASGEKFMAIKPWKGAIQAPSDHDDAKVAELANEPAKTLDLKHAFGYRCWDSRNNIFVTSNGSIVYPTAGIGVVVKDGKQKHYVGHDDDVVCMSLHPDGVLVASGQVGRRPCIRVWNSETMETVKVLPKVHERAVVVVAWSADGKLIASAGLDNDHTVAVYDFEAEKMVTTLQGGPDKILDLVFDDSKGEDGHYRFSTVGIKHIRFWDLDYKAKSLDFQKGIYGGKASPTTILSCTYIGGDSKLVSVTAKGQLMLWTGRQLTSVVNKAHNGAAYSVTTTSDDTKILTAGKDGVVQEWETPSLKPTGVSWENPSKHGVSTVQCMNSVVVLGTKGAEVIEMKYPLDNTKPIIHTSGHFRDELWGLAIHPTNKDMFITAGDDGLVQIWREDGPLENRRVKADIRSVAWSSDGHIALGTKAGTVMIVDEKLKDIKTVKLSAKGRSKEVSDMKFSPNGDYLAVGSHARDIDIFDTKKDYALFSTCKGHSSYITHVDWSVDGEHLQSTCGAYELLFWKKNGEQETSGASELKDEKWATWTCVLGWSVQGIYPPYSDGTDVNACDRSHCGTWLATGDDFGKVNLFNYPVIDTKSKCIKGTGHAAHVTCVRWLLDDEKLISIGGGDNTVMLWEVGNK